jgi:membrane protein implicated in regulation of membrane protease activity
MEPYFWLVLFIIFLVFEIATLGLFTIWFAGGAFVAFWMSVADFSFQSQIIVFLLVSFVLVVTTRPLAAKYVNSNTSKTNVDDLIGRTVKVSETIDNVNETGHVLINGVEWLARAQHDSMVIPKDTQVCVMEISGVKAIVQPLSIVNGPVHEKKEGK